MPSPVVSGASLTCSFGTSPGSLVVPPPGRPLVENLPLARVDDMQPTTNITPFGMCTTLSNPQVASATSAAQGVLTPQPCIPVITAPWTPGSAKVTAGGLAALTNTSTCSCLYGGVITVSNPGAVKVTVT